MSNIIKSNYVYLDKNATRVIKYNNPVITNQTPVIPGIGSIQDDGFQNIDYSHEAYKVDAIPKEEMLIEEALLSDNVDYELLNQQADNIIEEARIKADNIIEEAKITAKQLENDCFEEAKKEGYAQGYDMAQRDVEELKQALVIQQQANNVEYENRLCQLEQDMAEVVAQLIESITGVVVEEKNVVSHLIHRAFSNIENSLEYTIKVSREDYAYVNELKNELYNYVREGSVIEVVMDSSLGSNQCLIETDGNVIDCSLSEQLKNLKKELKLLALE